MAQKAKSLLNDSLWQGTEQSQAFLSGFSVHYAFHGYSISFITFENQEKNF